MFAFPLQNNLCGLGYRVLITDLCLQANVVPQRLVAMVSAINDFASPSRKTAYDFS